MAKYPYMVKHNGKYYPAGVDIPTSQEVSLVKEVKVEKKKVSKK